MANLTREMKDISFNNSFGFRPMPGTCEVCAFGRGHVHAELCVVDQARRRASESDVQIHDAVSSFERNDSKALGASLQELRTVSASSGLPFEFDTPELNLGLRELFARYKISGATNRA